MVLGVERVRLREEIRIAPVRFDLREGTVEGFHRRTIMGGEARRDPGIRSSGFPARNLPV